MDIDWIDALLTGMLVMLAYGFGHWRGFKRVESKAWNTICGSAEDKLIQHLQDKKSKMEHYK